jgi:hypothetical protein
LVLGGTLGCVSAVLIHLIWRDSVFVPTIVQKWATLPVERTFDGVSAYGLELLALAWVLGAVLIVRLLPTLWHFVRAWWAGITSFIPLIAALLMIRVLWPGPALSRNTFALAALLAALLACEFWRFQATRAFVGPKTIPELKIPIRNLRALAQETWEPSTGDDPIYQWNQDIIGRASVVEVLAEHIFVQRSSVVALHGGLGDGKSSVLNLLRQSLEGHAIIVSFSAWLPGSEETLAIDLFRDISTECKRILYIPQLKKQAIAYARTLSGSVSYLAGLKKILPARSQMQEIDEIRTTLAQVPLPIVVLLDEVDRMQRGELLVLLKILRGASSIPNVSFICAFSEEEMKKHLSPGAGLSYGYLEKFFPVTVNLASPDPDMVGNLFQDEVKTAAKNQNWFSGTDQKKFDELLDYIWRDSLSKICANLRKTKLLLNDVKASAHIIGGEVNALDLIGIEAVRRFAPEVYREVRKNSIFLTYGGDSWTKTMYMSEKRKEQEGAAFFAILDELVAGSGEPAAIRSILSFLFPAFAEAKEKGFSRYSLLRPTNEDGAEQDKRICSSDYFSIYFRAAIPEEMYSETELHRAIAHLNAAPSESKCKEILVELLNGLPKSHPKRTDMLWKLGRSVGGRLNDRAAEWLAYAAADRATEYAYDTLNLGEAAKALNIVFEATQKLSSGSKGQDVLVGAMVRATDDTFANRLLEFTEKRDRNKILVNFNHIDPEKLKLAFVERMRGRYGIHVDARKVDITTGDWWAFRRWADNSPDDKETETDFWRRYIGMSRKRLAQAISLLYPAGYSWSEDPRRFISTLFPFEELQELFDTLDSGEQLDETEVNALSRFQELIRGEWYDIARMRP